MPDLHAETQGAEGAMKRKALIIGNTGRDLPGVEIDMRNYKAFMTTPLGGMWAAMEITLLNNPSENTVTTEINALRQADYSFVVFCGHGAYQGASTFVQIRPGVKISEDNLKIGAAKHTLILDCCRVVEPEVATESLMAKADKVAPLLNPSDCRMYFDEKIADCPSGLVVMYACSVNETAGEGHLGGWYSTSLIDAAKQWHERSHVDTAKSYEILSVTDVHSRAEVSVKRRSGQRQNPVCDYPRTQKRFPFAIIA